MRLQHLAALSRAVIEVGTGNVAAANAVPAELPGALLESARDFVGQLSSAEVGHLAQLVNALIEQLDGDTLALRSLVQKFDSGKFDRGAGSNELPVPLALAKAALQPKNSDDVRLQLAPALQELVRSSLLKWAATRKGSQ